MNQKEGIRQSIVLYGPLIFSLILLGLTFAVKRHPSSYLIAMAAIYLVGFILFIKAKLSLIRSGHLFTFGPSQMTTSNRTFYKFGYALMGIGSILALVALIIP